MKETKLFELVTCTEMKPWLSRNKVPNINTCENGWSNFSANLRVVPLKLLELTQFAWPNLSLCFSFLYAVPCCDVIESPRFLIRPPDIIPQWTYLTSSSMVDPVWMEQKPFCLLYDRNVDVAMYLNLSLHFYILFF